MNNFSNYMYEYFDNYLNKVRKLSKNTIKTYKYAFIILLDFFKSEKEVRSSEVTIEMITSKNISEFINWLSEKGNENKTINNRLISIKLFMEYASKRSPEYLMFYNQIKDIKVEREKKKLIKWVSEEEIIALYKSLNSNNKKELKNLAILTLLYECALRVTSLCYLKVEDINIEKLEVTINVAKGNATGVVPITPEASITIQKYINMYSKEKQDYLFTTKNNTPYCRQAINKKINSMVEKVKSKYPNLKLTPHMIRHSRAMHLLNNKENPVPLTTIQKLLIHSSLSSTQVYAEANPETVRDAINRNAMDINAKRRYTKKEIDNLENWLKNSVNK